MTTQFKNHFSDRAAEYAAHRPTYPTALVDFLSGLTSDRGTAWDCGCGSGQLSVMLAEPFDRVLASDASADQIANATAHPRVRYLCAPAEASGLPTRVANLVVAAQAAHWFNLPKFYAEARRVAALRGVVALVAYGIMKVDDIVDEAVLSFYHEALRPHWPAERKLVELGYRTLDFPFREIHAPAFSMSARWDLGSLLGYLRTWSAVAALERAHGAEPFQHFQRQLARTWGDPGRLREVSWPLSLRVGFIE